MNNDLERLGHVDPPAPDVLDAAREVLWSAVAAEMLATEPAQARTTADQHQASHREHTHRKHSPRKHTHRDDTGA